MRISTIRTDLMCTPEHMVTRTDEGDEGESGDLGDLGGHLQRHSEAQAELHEEPFEREVGGAGDELAGAEVIDEARLVDETEVVGDLVAGADGDGAALPAGARRDSGDGDDLAGV